MADPEMRHRDTHPCRKGISTITTDQMTRAEVQAFGAKLDAFGNSLTVKEQALLREILLRAAQQGEVSGYHITALLPPTDPPVLFSQIVIVAGLAWG
jgi:hypothetical protein